MRVRMLRFAPVLYCFIICGVAGCTVSAATSVHDLQVAGVRIGMTSSAALTALRQNGIAARPLMRQCVHDYVETAATHKPLEAAPRHCVGGLIWTGNGMMLHVNLVEDMPARPGTTVVFEVSLNSIGSNATVDSVIARKALQGLGAPTLTEGKQPWTAAMWCSDQCTSIERQTANTRSAPYLYVQRDSGGGLTLMAQGFEFARYSAARAKLYAHGIKVSSF